MRWRFGATARYYLVPQKSLVLLVLILCLLLWSRAPNQTNSILRHWTATDTSTVWATLPENHPRESVRAIPPGHPRSIPRIQAQFGTKSAVDQAKQQTRLAAVERACKHAWTGYKQKAWGYDEIRPISGGTADSFGAWGATLVDTLDTLWIMGLHDDFEEAVNFAADIDFEVPFTNFGELNLFETTIRYLGGLLGAYDISDGRYPVLLRKATQLGHLLYHAFDTPNHMPVCHWKPQSTLDGHAQLAPGMALLAEIGSLSLEFTRLSQLTGDPKWYDAIAHVTDMLESQQNTTKLPGLWPTYVNPQTGDLASEAMFSVGGQADSAYEYLPKMHLLLGGSAQYASMYATFSQALKTHLLFQPMLSQREQPPLLFPSAGSFARGPLRPSDTHASNSFELSYRVEHLSCFLGGTLALAARALNFSSPATSDTPTDAETARRLTAGCTWAYHAMPHGIMPEILTLIPCSSHTCPWVESRWFNAVQCPEKQYDVDVIGARECIKRSHLPPGVASVDDPRYLLRPEAIESVFVMYRLTGERRYQEDAWKMFESIANATEVEFGHASLADVMNDGAGRVDEFGDYVADPFEREDKMESFWLAETLKYFWLIFAEEGVVSLDEYVLNTEAHPLRWRKSGEVPAF